MHLPLNGKRAIVTASTTGLARHYVQGMVARNWVRLVFLCPERELGTLVGGMGETLVGTGGRGDAVMPGVAKQVATRVVDLAAVGVQPCADCAGLFAGKPAPTGTASVSGSTHLPQTTRTLWEILAGTGVRVDAVVPGVAKQVATRVVDLAAVGVQPLC